MLLASLILTRERFKPSTVSSYVKFGKKGYEKQNHPQLGAEKVLRKMTKKKKLYDLVKLKPEPTFPEENWHKQSWEKSAKSLMKL